MPIRQAIQSEAQRLGFDWVGVTSPDRPPHLDTYAAWLADGRQAEMTYLATERARCRRADPRRILPECRSILTLGIRYPAQTQESEPPDNLAGKRPRGRVASYAWGGDYHELLAPKLKALAAFIETTSGAPVPNRWYTDTGPILEREMAQRAGLGWIGKNTCLIHPKQGSYFLLAEILLGVHLAPDPPFTADRCGACTRCLQACPTGCILPDRTIDSRRCISYLTIELKGAIQHELRPLMADWIFGCDICQMVCPWNMRFAGASGETAFAPRREVAYPDLIGEMALTPEAFNRKFTGSPVKRAKRRGYLRNVAVALGNSKNPAALPALRQSLLTDGESLVRAHAAWALGQIGGAAAVQALSTAAQSEKDGAVLGEIEAAAQSNY